MASSHIKILFTALFITLVGLSLAARQLDESTHLMTFQYHKGPLLDGKITANLIWYGHFKPAQRAIISDFITSLSSSHREAQPSVATWWNSIGKYHRLAGNMKPTTTLSLSIGKNVLEETYPIGKSLTNKHLVELASKGGQQVNAVNIVLTSSDVAVDGFCSSRCGTHGSSYISKSTSQKFTYIWVGNSETQCPGQCAWPFHQPIYGPQSPPLVAPNNDVGLDGMVINLASLLAGTVTNPYGNGYYQGPKDAPLEAASACPGVYGKGAYPGYAGNLLVNPTYTTPENMAATATDDAIVAAPTHILVFPYPAQGHMPALLDLTHQLALRGFKSTILVTPKNLPALTPLLLAHPTSVETLVLPLPPHPKLPLGVENVKDVGNSGNAPITAALSRLKGEVIQWFQSHPSPPQAILSDFFLGCTQQWATQLNIPRIAFFSVSAFLTCLFTRLWQHLDKLHALKMVEFPDLPSSPSFVQDHLPSIFKNFREGDPDWEIVKEGMLANPKSWGYAYNSFYALEGEYLDRMTKELGHGRIYSIGPLGLIGLSERVNPGSDTRYSVLNWLDKCTDGSVLYVCFGSQKLLTEQQIRALALGLERSKTRFIWVIKPVSSQHVPDGFEERVSDRGVLLRGWAPQVEILNHKAVGGFMSHCGWNSLLESVMAGVMLLAWPMEADQFVNAKLLVEYTGLAVKLCEGEHTVPDSDTLARIIAESFGQIIPQKERTKAMREKALEAVKAGGSSAAGLEELVKELTRIGVPKKKKKKKRGRYSLRIYNR